MLRLKFEECNPENVTCSKLLLAPNYWIPKKLLALSLNRESPQSKLVDMNPDLSATGSLIKLRAHVWRGGAPTKHQLEDVSK